MNNKQTNNYLDGGEVGRYELREGLVLVLQFLTDLRILKAAPDLVPVLGVLDPFLQPVGVIPKPVLLVPSPGDGLPGALIGDDEGEDGEAEEDEDEDEHGEEVDPEQPGDAAAGADEPREGDHEEEHPDRDDRSGEVPLALGAVRALAQPDPRAQDRDREQEGDEV